ncbi:MAG: SGNH/GDSL hydrolase family protein [Ruminococcus sp.]|nr:SGNH/GDSL hydrolase family protein [Ruminococcus sp.]
MILKRIAAVIVASLALGLSACSMTEIPAREVVHNIEVPPKMLFLGDSIAAGYGLDGYTSEDNYSCRSYANILRERYEVEIGSECGHTMVNRAVSGYTSFDLIEQISSGELDSDLSSCDAVVISIGGNDLLDIMLELMKNMGITEKGSFESDSFDLFSAAGSLFNIRGDIDSALERFEENMRTIAEELLKRTEGTIYIQTLYDPLEYFSRFSIVTDFSAEKIGRLNRIISENSSIGYKVIDVAADFKGKAGELTNISSYDIHPNAKGHEIIAGDVDAAFRATGFSYVTTEYGDERLTAEGKKTVSRGIAGASVIALLVLIGICLKKKD